LERYTETVPTLLKAEGFRFFFFSNEGSEPPHIHVEYGDGYAKFWLEPVQLASQVGMKPKDLRRAREIIQQQAERFKEQWHAYFRT
jgi:hypothetical protein